MTESKKAIEVAVGVIVRGEHIFLTKRAEHLHQGGKWEFPGGKREANETMPEALARELQEEVGISIASPSPLLEIRHNYPDKSVFLDVYVVDDFTGEPTPQEGQVGDWVERKKLAEMDFPEANKVIIEKLLN